MCVATEGRTAKAIKLKFGGFALGCFVRGRRRLLSSENWDVFRKSASKASRRVALIQVQNRNRRAILLAKTFNP